MAKFLLYIILTLFICLNKLWPANLGSCQELQSLFFTNESYTSMDFPKSGGKLSFQNPSDHYLYAQWASEIANEVANLSQRKKSTKSIIKLVAKGRFNLSKKLNEEKNLFGIMRSGPSEPALYTEIGNPYQDTNKNILYVKSMILKNMHDKKLKIIPNTMFKNAQLNLSSGKILHPTIIDLVENGHDLSFVIIHPPNNMSQEIYRNFLDDSWTGPDFVDTILCG
jgi:hypothetical protein